MATIADFKKAWDDANARGDIAGMNTAHTGADNLRGYQTDSSGQTPIGGSGGYVPPNAVWNNYGEVIGTSPGGSTTIQGGAGTNIHGGWNGDSYPGVNPTITNINGTGVNLLNNGTPIIGGNEEKVQKVDPIQPTTTQDSDIQQYIRDLAAAHCAEDNPHYHPNLIQDDSDLDEEIFT